MSELISFDIVKLRKPNRCFGCLAPLPKGSTAERNVCKGDSGLYTIYLCEDCAEFEKTLPDEYWADGCYYEGDLREAKRQEGWKTEVKAE